MITSCNNRVFEDNTFIVYDISSLEKRYFYVVLDIKINGIL